MPSAMNPLAPRPSAAASSDTTPLTSTIHRFRPSKSFPPPSISPSATAEITSLDFSPSGEYLITTSTSEDLQIYDIPSGTHSKTLFSKKYGCHLARFTHNPSTVLHCSTKENDTIRYLSVHDNTYIRYFRGHNAQVTSLEISPVDDQFISASSPEGSVRLWDTRSATCHGVLHLAGAGLATFDPSGIIFAVASHETSTISLYDLRNYDKAPFTTFNVTDSTFLSAFSYPARMPAWTTLQFSNDGKNMLLGTRGHAHYIVDSFAENTTKFYGRLERRRGPPKVKEEVLTSGDACFSPDGRYVVGGQAERGLLVWDLEDPVDEKRSVKPRWELGGGGAEPGSGSGGQASGGNGGGGGGSGGGGGGGGAGGKMLNALVAFNPRLHVLVSAHKDVVFWLPEQHAPDPPQSP